VKEGKPEEGKESLLGNRPGGNKKKGGSGYLSPWGAHKARPGRWTKALPGKIDFIGGGGSEEKMREAAKFDDLP